MMVSSAVDRAEDGSARGYAQRFERGIVVYTCQPGEVSPDRWFVLFAERQGVRLWSSFDPALLEPPAQGRRAGTYLPPRGCCLPAPGFGVVWLALKDLLGWALRPAEACQLAGPSMHAPPIRLVTARDTHLALHADRTWTVETRADVSSLSA
jgi:hypothetical protein